MEMIGVQKLNTATPAPVVVWGEMASSATSNEDRARGAA